MLKKMTQGEVLVEATPSSHTRLVLYIDIRYIPAMIRSVADKTTQDVYDGTNSRHARKLPRDLHGKTRRLLDQINTAPTLEFLRTPPTL